MLESQDTTIAAQFDEIANRFEEAWRAGKSPRPEDYLAEIDAPHRLALLRELQTVLRQLSPVGSDAPDAGAQNGTQNDVLDSTLAHERAAVDTQNQSPGAPPVVPGYELAERIGRGGMGDVYRARDLEMDREVAVKILQEHYPIDSPTAARFLEEARITGQLQHPGIPAVYRVARLADGRPFLAMKLIRGRTLDELLRRKSPINHLAVIEAVAQAVGYAHAHDVIHRDLKPQNVMVGKFGEVQVMDWGLAKVLSLSAGNEPTDGDPEATTAGTLIRTPRESDYTQAGSMLGTPAYMPPEQAASEVRRIGKASDVFGIGAVWCKLLTGEPPFTGDDIESVRRNALRGKTEEALARLDRCGAEPEVVTLCKWCLAVEPEDRPADANDVARLVAELRLAAEERARAAELSRARAEVHVAEQAKRRRVVQRAAIAVAAALFLGLVAMGVGLWKADAARRTARLAEQDADVKRLAAEAAEKREAKQRELAVAETELANEVKGFLKNDVLLLADPATQQQEGEALPYDADVRLRDVVLRAAVKVECKFKDRPLVEAEIRHTLGYALHGMGRSDLAATHFERVREVREQYLGPDHPDTLDSMNNLANSYSVLGQYADALKLYEETLALRKAKLGPDHLDTLLSMHNLGVCYSNLGRYDDALALREETLALAKAKLGPDHPHTLVNMHELAMSYSEVGRYDDALELREETLALWKVKLGPDHPDTLRCMVNLACSYREVGRHDEALKLSEETLALIKAKLGPDHPDTLTSMHNLAISYRELGRHADALNLNEETLALRKAKFGPDHADTLSSMHSLADSYAALYRLDDALKLHEETLALRKAKLGPYHADTLNSEWGVIAALVSRAPEATPRIDALVRLADQAVAAGKRPDPRLVPQAFAFRIQIHRDEKDSAGCRATAEMWEERQPKSLNELYSAARWRSVTATVQAQGDGDDAATLAQQEGDRAMDWLKKAVAAGFKNRAHMEKDAYLEFLRTRDDFKNLLESLPSQ